LNYNPNPNEPKNARRDQVNIEAVNNPVVRAMNNSVDKPSQNKRPGRMDKKRICFSGISNDQYGQIEEHRKLKEIF
jgi:hypothetical protein